MERRKLEKKIYEYLGVNVFRKVLLFIDKLCKPLGGMPGYRLKSKTIEELKEFRKSKIELWLTHAIMQLFVWLPFINSVPVYWVIVNAYCVMVQRYDYMRVDEIIKKHDELEQRRKEKAECVPEPITESDTKQEKEDMKDALAPQKDFFENVSIEKQNQLLEALGRYHDAVYGNIEEDPTNTSQGYCKKYKMRYKREDNV